MGEKEMECMQSDVALIAKFNNDKTLGLEANTNLLIINKINSVIIEKTKR